MSSEPEIDDAVAGASRVPGLIGVTACRGPGRRRIVPVLAMLGLVAAMLLNPRTGPGARAWIKKRVFGPEHTFDYEG